MSETVYYLMVGGVLLVFLMIFQPFRQFVLGVVGAKSVWGMFWSIVASILIAHWVVLKNFLPRNFVLPTLDDRKTTNAED